MRGGDRERKRRREVGRAIPRSVEDRDAVERWVRLRAPDHPRQAHGALDELFYALTLPGSLSSLDVRLRVVASLDAIAAERLRDIVPEPTWRGPWLAASDPDEFGMNVLYVTCSGPGLVPGGSAMTREHGLPVVIDSAAPGPGGMLGGKAVMLEKQAWRDGFDFGAVRDGLRDRGWGDGPSDEPPERRAVLMDLAWTVVNHWRHECSGWTAGLVGQAFDIGSAAPQGARGVIARALVVLDDDEMRREARLLSGTAVRMQDIVFSGSLRAGVIEALKSLGVRSGWTTWIAIRDYRRRDEIVDLLHRADYVVDVVSSDEVRVRLETDESRRAFLDLVREYGRRSGGPVPMTEFSDPFGG